MGKFDKNKCRQAWMNYKSVRSTGQDRNKHWVKGAILNNLILQFNFYERNFLHKIENELETQSKILTYRRQLSEDKILAGFNIKEKSNFSQIYLCMSLRIVEDSHLLLVLVSFHLCSKDNALLEILHNFSLSRFQFDTKAFRRITENRATRKRNQFINHLGNKRRIVKCSKAFIVIAPILLHWPILIKISTNFGSFIF